MPGVACQLRAVGCSDVGLVPLVRGSGLIRGKSGTGWWCFVEQRSAAGSIRFVGCRVGAAPAGAGTALRLTRQGFLQPFVEHDLCVARLDCVQARGAWVVGVGEGDVGAEGGGDLVSVCDEPAGGAVVDAVGEGFSDLFAAEAGLGEFGGEGGGPEHPPAGLLAFPARSGDEPSGCGGLQCFAPPAVPGADIAVLDDQVRAVVGGDVFGDAAGGGGFCRSLRGGGVGEGGPGGAGAGGDGGPPGGGGWEPARV